MILLYSMIAGNCLSKAAHDCKLNFPTLPFEEFSSLSRYFGVLLKKEHTKFWKDCSKIFKTFLRNHLMTDHIAKTSDFSRYLSISREFSVFWSISGLKRGTLYCFQNFLSMLNPNY